MEKIFSRTVKNVDGHEVDLSYLNDKIVLVVNTASECGLTKQLEGLQYLYNKYKDRNFEVIAFPSNNFGNQEPLDNMDIAKVYRNRYGVQYPIMSKIDVIEGNIDPLYEKLFEKSGSKPEWNFGKYLVSHGKEVVYFPSTAVVDEVEPKIESKL